MKNFIDLLISMVTITVCFSFMSDSLEKAEDFMSTCFIIFIIAIPLCYAYRMQNISILCVLMAICTIGTVQKLRRGRPLIEFD